MPYVPLTEEQVKEAIRSTRTIAEAARRLGVTRRTVYRYINLYGLVITREVR